MTSRDCDRLHMSPATAPAVLGPLHPVHSNLGNKKAAFSLSPWVSDRFLAFSWTLVHFLTLKIVAFLALWPGHPHFTAFLASAVGTLAAFLESAVAARLYLHFCTWGPQSNERRRRNF